MKKIRTGTILLCVCLLLSFFAGCGASTPAESTPAGSVESSADHAASTVETEPETQLEAATELETPVEPSEEAGFVEEREEPEEPVYTISYPLSEELQTLSLYCTACNFMGPLSVVSMNWEDFDCYKQLEEQTNVHIDFESVSFESYLSSYNIYIAAGDYADLLINVEGSYVGGTTAALDEGVIVDLTPFLEEYAPDYNAFLNSDPKLREGAYNADDQVLKFIAAYDVPGIKNGSIVRGDWLEQLGVEVTDIDSLHAYLLAAKDLFGADTPVFMTSGANDFMTGFNIGSYSVGGGNIGFYVEDGQVKTPLNQDAYRDYLTMMRDWFQEGLIYQDFATTFFDPHGNTLNQMIYNGQVAVWATQLEGLDDYKANATDPDFISAPIPSVTLTGEKNHATAVEYVITDSSMCVSSNCENVPLAVSWMNYWYTDEGIRMYNYGPEGDAYHLEGDKVVLEDFVLNNEYGVDVSSFLRMYCPYGSFVGVYLRSRLTDYSSQLQLDAARIWTDSNDGAFVIPNGVSVSAADNETLSSTASDILTYADTCIPKFIMGDMDIDTEWDTYIDTLESMGIADCVAIEQAAYDSYIS